MQTRQTAGLIALMFLAGCGRSCVDVALERDCNDGAQCNDQAQALVKRNLTERSPERAAKALVLFQRGCDLGYGPACDASGFWLEDGGLGTHDLPAALRRYEKGCALKDVNCCDDLAHIYHGGRGIPKDPALESKYRQLACGLADRMTRETFCEW
jgi:TPR repeat protein